MLWIVATPSAAKWQTNLMHEWDCNIEGHEKLSRSTPHLFALHVYIQCGNHSLRRRGMADALSRANPCRSCKPTQRRGAPTSRHLPQCRVALTCVCARPRNGSSLKCTPWKQYTQNCTNPIPAFSKITLAFPLNVMRFPHTGRSDLIIRLPKYWAGAAMGWGQSQSWWAGSTH